MQNTKTTELNSIDSQQSPLPAKEQRIKDVDEAKKSSKTLESKLKAICLHEYWKYEPYGVSKTSFIETHFPKSRATFYRISTRIDIGKFLASNNIKTNYSDAVCQSLSTFIRKFGEQDTLKLIKFIENEFEGEMTADLVKKYLKAFEQHQELLPLSEYPQDKESDKNSPESIDLVAYVQQHHSQLSSNEKEKIISLLK